VPRITVGLAATPRDAAIVEWVSTFAVELRADVIVVHVIPRTTLWLVSSVQADSDRYVARLRARFERDVVAQLRARGISVTLRVVRGDAAMALAGIADQTGCDLIVIGGPDHHALHDAVSSIARRLEHASSVPIVLVPHAKVGIHAQR
jgi:nucleotide-binding universal stress UspA family protein